LLLALASRPSAADEAAVRADERAMVRAMAAGDDAGLTALYDQLAPRILAVLDRMLATRAEAEELLQEVFVELWRRAEQYRDDRGSVRAWAMTIARSRAVDQLRKRRRRRDGDHAPAGDGDLVAPESGRPDRAADRRQSELRVGAALAELSAEQREVLELAYFGGLSHSEIADRLGIPLGTVKSRIIAGMKRLRARLKGETERG
jgi:RNA polymerase sigma-70 factor (ECF subfamily)